jgi:TPR repeat protein
LLGVCYERGQGIPADLKTAFRWYVRAARRGYQDAALSLARFYENGQGQTASAVNPSIDACTPLNTRRNLYRIPIR